MKYKHNPYRQTPRDVIFFKKQTKINELEETKMSEEETKNSWMKEEIATLKETKTDYVEKPSLKLEEDKITEFSVDFSNKFDEWIDPTDKTLKKIIPVMAKNEEGTLVEHNLWMNVKNPLYRQLLDEGAKGTTSFKVHRTGQKKNTRYSLVKD